MNERLGKWNFWIMFIGFNLGFFPMHIAGLLGMPRRIYTYPAGLGWDIVNLVITIGAYPVRRRRAAASSINVAISLRRGARAGANPWDAPTLEWATSSPPPPYNFAVIPTVASRHPLWEDRAGRNRRPLLDRRGPAARPRRETIGTSALDAVPDVILEMPGDSAMPFLLSIAWRYSSAS